MESFHQLRLPKEPTLAVGHKRKLKPNAVLTVFHTRRLNVTDWQAKKKKPQEASETGDAGCSSAGM